MSDDVLLLRRYAETRDEAAFTALVGRHFDAVYSVALRRVGGDAPAARDVAQQVFTALARDARRLADHPVLIGWLHTTTRHVAANAVRGERRRKHREQEAHAMNEALLQGPPEVNWNEVAPVLEDAIDELGETDRHAVLLRFIERRPFAEIGAALRLTEDTARRRVDRALDKLRAGLARRGIASTAAALASVLTSHAISAAPAGLAAAVAGAALSGASGTAAASTFLTLTKIQVGIAAAVLVAAGAGLMVKQRSRSAPRADAIQLAARAENLGAESLRLTQTPVVAIAPIASTPLTAQPPATPLSRAAESSPSLASAGHPGTPAERTKLHQRYDPFLIGKLALTAEQADRFVDLKLAIAAVQADLQAAMVQTDTPGGTKGIEALRSRFTRPLWDEIYALVGPHNRAAVDDYERMSACRPTVDHLFSDSAVALTDEQANQVTRLILANQQVYRVRPTDLGSQIRIDWDAVAAQSGAFLTAIQQAVLRDHAQQEKRQP